MEDLVLEGSIVPQVILGMDVGTYSIKIARAERGLGEFHLTDFYEIPLPAHDVLTHEQTTEALLTRFMEENKIQYDTMASSISGLQCAFRALDFPFNQSKKIDSAIEFELENYVPFPLEDLWVDYVLLEKGASSSKVLAVYTPQAGLVKFLNILSHANCDPRYVGVECTDLANLQLSGMLPPQGTYAILDLGHVKTNLCVMQDGKLRAVRTIAMGGKHITQAIAKALKLDYDKAEALKLKQSQISPFEQGDEVSEVIHRVLEDLLIQVRQSLFAFYEKGEKKIEAVYLCGGTSKLSGIDQYISTHLRLNVSPLDALDYSFTKLGDPESARSLIAPALALIFRVVYPSKSISLNFRRGEFAYTKDIQAISGQFSQLGYIAAALVVLGIIYFTVSLSMLSSRGEKMDKSVTKILTQGISNPPKKLPSGAQGALSYVSSKISEASDRLKKMEGSNTPSALEILRLISANLPQRQEIKLDVDDMNISSDHVRMEGKTVSYEAVDKIKSALEKVPGFKNVQTGNVRKGIQDEIKFSLSLDVGA